jgi:hypothetical protein
MLELSREKYKEFNDTHFAEKLVEQEGIEVSRETVSMLRGRAGIEPSGDVGLPNIASVGSGWLRRGRWCFGMGVPIFETQITGRIFEAEE